MAEDFSISPGSPDQLGLVLSPQGGNFALYSETATAVDFCLFDAADREIARLRLPGRSGPVFHGFIHGLQAGARYGLRVHGPYDPAQGARHNPAKLLIDPYALGLDRFIEPHPSMLGFDADGLPSRGDSAPFVAKAIAQSPVLAPSPPRAKKSWPQTMIYELHVRGFTRLMPEIPDRQRGTFAGLAHPAAIARLQNLGVTTLELLPCAAWIDERHLPPLGLTNYWGYNSVAFMAPDPRLAPGGWKEVRESVATLQAAGFDVLIDIVLNHSGESDQFGPTLSLRGIDNASYYRLAENPAHYINDAGCGNILRFDHPAVVRLAMDTLRAWTQYGGVDGFRFDLAVTLARGGEGFDAFAPLLAAIDQDPVLRHIKMIAEPWDVGPGGYHVGKFPPRWSDWNDIFRDDVRKFWRGDRGMIGGLATALAGSEPMFGKFGRPTKSINFVTAHDGFTLADLVAYAYKHNEANGEHNRDGTDANHSWNNGVEGPTDDERILALRRRDQRNLLATLFCARGVPMLAMGSECGHSQNGNNNAYAQDNLLTWIDWGKADAKLIAFTRKLIALRMGEAALHADAFLTGALLNDGSIPDARWYGAEGEAMRDDQWRQDERRFIGLSLYAENSRALILLNAGGDVTFPLPAPRAGKRWRLVIDTFDDATDERFFGAGDSLPVEPRSVKILVEAV
ncbi:glycogen debranching protein GlgX [uncultured Rhodoblastus sp.]|uniref:glycogen debranching protein GlgX n=1 Tax=uncultured Rhodoblastus sp. TaxID=543037 RepID=UPI0025D072E1|nr:glycogen debranching protein GlgX [uncultured Rhodoblastus sp.]